MFLEKTERHIRLENYEIRRLTLISLLKMEILDVEDFLTCIRIIREDHD
jgi:uncharacterized protein YqgQ